MVKLFVKLGEILLSFKRLLIVGRRNFHFKTLLMIVPFSVYCLSLIDNMTFVKI